ncbi:unnamed protein product [Urochloa humidicola]
MDRNSQPPAPPAATIDSYSTQDSSSQLTAAVAAGAATMHGHTSQPGAAMLRPPTGVGVLAFRPVLQHSREKIPVFRHPAPPAPAVRTANQQPRTLQVPEQQHFQGSSSQMVPTVAAPTAMLGVGRPLAPATAVMLANRPSPRFVEVANRLTLSDLQGSKLPVVRGPSPRPELAGSISGNSGLALVQSSSSDTGPCVLNKQAGPPSPDYSSTETDSDNDSEDYYELEMLVDGKWVRK